ncbi:nSTAND1 domain-containing NTPase [Nocardia gamkensis]|uniref:nSTAND1 domain-containing NTPase n=1 Tax=Nocardia gamkensis TaxID=352869 RepID=UPI0037C5A2A6
MTRVFLSHSSRDNVRAVALVRWLGEQQPGLAGNIFLDSDEKAGIPQGVRWRDALRRAITRCEAVICLTSRDWHASTECVAEYLTAENLGKRIYCAALEPVTDLDATRAWQRCDLFGDGPVTEIPVDGSPEPVRFRTEGLRRLLAGLGDAGIGAENFPWPPANEPDRSPYRGWQPFDAVDAAVYFGRDAQIRQGMDRLRGIRAAGSESVFAVVGPSGTGKSSFLRAGLLPRLMREDRQFLVLGLVRPEKHALTGAHGLAAAIHATRARLGLTAPALGDIKAALPGDTDRIRDWLLEIQHAARDRQLDDGAAPPPTLLLPIDQAEELFVADAGVQGEQFLALLGRLLVAPEVEAGPQPPIIAVLTIRTDRYEQLQNAPQFDGVRTYVFNELKPLPRTQFKEVITAPAARADEHAPLTIEPQLVDRLLADGDHGADTLPLLALTLSRLYDDYASGGVLTLEQYSSIGGIDRVVQTEIDALLSTDPDARRAQLRLLRSAFVPALATINPDNDQPMRRIASWAELPAESHPLIDAFVNKRLLVKDHRDGRIVVEVALESLLRQWEDLAGWLLEQADDLKAADRLEQAARAWEHNGRDEAWLWGGTRLTEAETLSANPAFQRRLEPTREFLLAGRHRERDRIAALRRQARTLAALLVVAAAVAVLAGIGFWRADIASDRADARTREAVVRRLLTDSDSILSGNRSSSDTRALHEILTARAIDRGQTDKAVIDALYARKHLRTVFQTGEPISSLALSPDGSRIVTSGAGRIGSFGPDARPGRSPVRLWDSASGVPIETPPRFIWGPGPAEAVAFSPDGQRVAVGRNTGIELWDAVTAQPSSSSMTGAAVDVKMMAFSPDGQRIVSGGLLGTLQLWDVRAGQQISSVLSGAGETVVRVAFRPDGQPIAAVRSNGVIRLRDATTARQIGPALTGDGNGVRDIAFSPDGSRMIFGDADGTLRLRDTTTGEQIGAPWNGDGDGAVVAVSFSPDGKRVVSADSNHAVRLWDTVTGRPIGTALTGHTDLVADVVFSADGTEVVSGGRDGSVRIWDVASIALTYQNSAFDALAVSPDGNRIVSGGEDGVVQMWDVRSAQPIGRPMTGHTGAVTQVAFSPDGRRIASASVDGTARLWNADTGELFGGPLVGHRGVLWGVAFSPDGARLVTSGERRWRWWDVESGQPLDAPPAIGHPLMGTAVTVSPDGRVLAAGSDQVPSVLLFDVATGKAPNSLGIGTTGSVQSAAFSPDGKTIASAADSRIILWDAASAQQSAILQGHTEAVSKVAFSPDGRVLASVGLDRTIRLWDIPSGQPRAAPLTGHTAAITDVAFLPDGKTIGTSGVDGTIKLTPVYSADPARICAKLTVNPSPEQWDDFVSKAIPYTELCPGLPRAATP